MNFYGILGMGTIMYKKQSTRFRFYIGFSI